MGYAVNSAETSSRDPAKLSKAGELAHGQYSERALRNPPSSSNAAINYAIMNRSSTNYFYPVYRSRYDMLLKHQKSLPNMIVSGDYAQHDYPGG